MRRLQRSDPKDPPFGTYHTVRDEDGLYHSTLQLTDKARAAARLKKLQYKGEGARTIKQQSYQQLVCFGMIPV